MSRTPEEIIDNHARALAAADIDAVLSDYTDDARFITPDGVVSGHPALRETFTGVLQKFPGFSLSVTTQVVDGDTVLLEWTADSATHTITDGVDTFLIRGGCIHLQTARFTVHPKTGGAADA